MDKHILQKWYKFWIQYIIVLTFVFIMNPHIFLILTGPVGLIHMYVLTSQYKKDNEILQQHMTKEFFFTCLYKVSLLFSIGMTICFIYALLG